MGVVRKFEQHKYVLPVQQGSGFADTVSSVANFVSQHKDTLKNVGKAASSVAGATGKISDAVKAAKRFNELHDIKLARAAIPPTVLPPKVVSDLQAAGRTKKGDGFEKF